jgi:HSP20 family protein
MGGNTTMNTTCDASQRRANEPVRAEYHAPAVDILETKDSYVLEADMPGVDKDGIEVLLEGSELTIKGHRPAAPANGYLIRESSDVRGYRRSFVLDPLIDTNKLAATIEQGVLRVRLPKAERIKPRKIKVTD